ncbi:hypothetical protein J7F03_00170 [Streptomyces sp. ISL-43]|uniref:hypothetical protein n=1 Tax=Streptomyces sp. ISL-43 TaxID=2819183 RepID=UPI001BE73364|nr:hypothetical protein [Streptomyces sp. ISL-43]MBT2445538.1 hypothetical protein [Streptomyces sp. ISL-43]
MNGAADLQAFLRVSNERALGKLLDRIHHQFPIEVSLESSETYWKDPGLRDVRFRVKISPEPLGGIISHLMIAGWSVASTWMVTSVGELLAPGWHFEAIAYKDSSTFAIQGIEWAKISFVSEIP